HHDVARASYQYEMLYIVAPDEHQTALVVDGHRVRNGESWAPVAAAGHERARCHTADNADDQQHDEEKDEGGHGPYQGSRILLARQACKPIAHLLLRTCWKPPEQ